jgi:hypothetical protein
MSRAGTAQPSSSGTGSGTDSEPGVVDAEFEEVDERKRKAS